MTPLLFDSTGRQSNPGATPTLPAIHGNPQECWGGGGLAGGVITVPGSGDWFITRTGVGLYTITFLNPFNNLPTISCDMVTSGTTARGVGIMSYSVSGFNVQSVIGGANTDSEFHFIAEAIN